MIRIALVSTLIIIGAYYALQSPFYALLFYLWNAYFRPEEKLWQDFLQTANLSFLIASYLLVLTVFSKKTLVVNGRTMLIGLLLLQTFLSTWLSPYYEVSWPFWMDFLKRNIIGCTILMLVDDFSKFRLVLLVIALSLGIPEAKQGWVYLLTSPGGPNTNPLPFLGDNNGVAVGMLMLVPIFVFLAQTTSSRWARPFYWFLLIGVLYRAISTYSRGGFLAACVLGMIYWLGSRQKIRALVVLLAVLVIVVPNIPDAFWTRMDTLNASPEEMDESSLGRLHFWQVALQMAQANPFFGVGFNAFNAAYDHYDFSQGMYGRMRSVHSSLFGVIAELGYLGFTLFVLILLSAFLSCHRVSRIVRFNPELANFHVAAASLRISLFVFLVGGSFVNFQYQEMLWHYIFLLFSLDRLASQTAIEHDKDVPGQMTHHPAPSLSVNAG